MSITPSSRPAAFILHENSTDQLDLWLDLQSAIPETQSAWTYFLYESVLLLDLMRERGFKRPPHCHLMACSLALREHAVSPDEDVLASGLPSLGRMLDTCAPVHHLGNHYPKLISESLAREGDATHTLHLQVSNKITRTSLLTEALRVVYGLNMQTDIHITLGVNEGQKTVLFEDPLCTHRLHELVSMNRFCSNPPERAKLLHF